MTVTQKQSPTTIPDNAILHRDDRKFIDWFMVPESDNSEYSFSGKCYTVAAWEENTTPCMWEEVATIYLKWDNCCHLGLRDPEMDNEWVHICGEIDRTLAMLRWMYEEAKARIPKWNP